MPKFVLPILFGLFLIAPTACVPPQEPPVPPKSQNEVETFRRFRKDVRPGSTGVEPVLVRPGATGVEPARFGGGARPLIDPRGGFVRPGATSIEPRN